MSELNIVELIEKNPITKLSQSYNNKLLSKIKHVFTNSHQQLFISSFYCSLNYHQTNDFVINLDDIWKWLEFSKKAHAKVVLEKNFTIEKDYRIIQNNKREHKGSGSGGHNKETIMLNVSTFKSFCLKAGTKKADEIHEYFIKLEEILQQTIGEECIELKNQLQQITIEQKNNQLKTQQLDREKMLLREFGTKGPIVYIIKVKTFENGQYIVKIGESRKGIQRRYNEHKSNYEECILLDCFAIKKSNEFEKFLHKNEKIKFNRVNDLPNHESEVELFLIGKDLSYDMLLEVINENKKHFDDYNDIYVEKLHSELEALKYAMANSKNISKNAQQTIIQPELLQIILENQTQMAKQIQSIEKSNKEILEKLNAQQIKTTTNFNKPLDTLGPYLQKINAETLTLIKTYESVAECIKETNFRLKRPSINKAVIENTVYNGFRWAFVDRQQDPTIIYNLNPTKKIKVQNNGYIAKVSSDKTQILTVYIDRKTAAIQNGYTSISALDNPVKNKTITNDNYYILFDNCDENIKQEFINKYGEPFLYRDGVGQYDINNVLIREFACKYDCIKQLKMSDKTLVKLLDKDNTYNMYYFKRIGQKLFV